jgi:hypothetical protein
MATKDQTMPKAHIRDGELRIPLTGPPSRRALAFSGFWVRFVPHGDSLRYSQRRGRLPRRFRVGENFQGYGGRTLVRELKFVLSRRQLKPSGLRCLGNSNR